MVQLPGLNTPQFDHCLSKMPRHPQPVPPIFQPDVAARSVYWAAHQRRREVYVGFPTVYTIIGNKLAPWFAERYLAKTAIDGQQTPDRYDGTKAANLFTAVDDDHDEGPHGIFDRQAKRRSAQAWLTRHRTAVGAAGPACSRRRAVWAAGPSRGIGDARAERWPLGDGHADDAAVVPRP